MIRNVRPVFVLIAAVLLLVGGIAWFQHGRVGTGIVSPLVPTNRPMAKSLESGSQQELTNPASEVDETNGAPSSFKLIEFSDVDPDLVDPVVVQSFLARHQRDYARYRIVIVNSDEILDAIRDSLRGVDRMVKIALFPDVVISAKTSTAQEGYSGLQAGIAVWRGKALDVPSGQSALQIVVSPDGSVSGEFVLPLGSYAIDSTDQPPYHIIWQMPLRSGPDHID